MQFSKEINADSSEEFTRGTQVKGKEKINESPEEKKEGENVSCLPFFSKKESKERSSTRFVDSEVRSSEETESLIREREELPLRDKPLRELNTLSAKLKHYSYWSCTNFLVSIGLLALLSDLIVGILEGWPSKPLNSLEDKVLDGIDITIGTVPFLLMILDFFIICLYDKFKNPPLAATKSERLHQHIQKFVQHAKGIDSSINLDEETAGENNSYDFEELRIIEKEIAQSEKNEEQNQKFNSTAIRGFLTLRLCGYLLTRDEEVAALTLSFLADGAYSFLALFCKFLHINCGKFRARQTYVPTLENQSAGRNKDFVNINNSQRITPDAESINPIANSSLDRVSSPTMK